MNDPTVGGYLGWQLGPEYRIYMDMQVPFLFTEKDIFMGINALQNENSFRRFASKFQLDYIAAPAESNLHRKILAHSQRYVPVFFDDLSILYVDRQRRPAIADRYRLKHIHQILDDSWDLADLHVEDEQDFLQEARRMVKIYPEGYLINRLLTAYYLREKSFAKATQHADRLIQGFPERAEGYMRKGEILREQQSYAAALPFYYAALDRSDGQPRARLYKAIWACHFSLRQYQRAYRSLKKAVNFFSPRVDTADLFRMAQTAYHVGKFEEARMLAEFAAFKTEKKVSQPESNITNLSKNLEKSPR